MVINFDNIEGTKHNSKTGIDNKDFYKFYVDRMKNFFDNQKSHIDE